MTLTAAFRRPFAYQVAAFRLRLQQLAPTVVWTDIWQEQHDRAFMVAGALKADLLADLAAAVDKAISQGTGLEEFRRDFRQIVKQRGWHGWTGEGTKRGEAWRTRVIYRTNMATSYAAGRWAQLREAGYRYIVYHHGNSLEPRIQHLAWDGLVLEADHPFWATHAPPNGWGCSCYVSGARTMDQARRLGGKPDKGLPDGWQARDPRTGAPVGIDKGWAYAPGASVADEVGAMAQKAVHLPYDLAKAFMSGVPEAVADDLATAYRSLPSVADGLRRYAESVPRTGSIDEVEKMRTLGLLTSADRAQVRGLAGVDVSGFDFVIDPSGIRHAFNRHGAAATEAMRGQRAILSGDFGRLGQVLNAPDLVALEGMDGSVPVLRFEKQFGTERIVALFAVRTGRRRLALVTMWIKAG